MTKPRDSNVLCWIRSRVEDGIFRNILEQKGWPKNRLGQELELWIMLGYDQGSLPTHS